MLPQFLVAQTRKTFRKDLPTRNPFGLGMPMRTMKKLALTRAQKMQAMKKGAKKAFMDDRNKALCIAFREAGVPRKVLKSKVNKKNTMKPMPFSMIAKKVYKTNGRHPSAQAVSQVVESFHGKPAVQGRPRGTRKTTKEDDAIILKTFLKIRPPGVGVTARDIHEHLPKRLQKLVSIETIRLRLAEKGFKPTRKILKSDPDMKLRKARLGFCKSNKHRTRQGWKSYLQAAGDMKDFTYYPKKLMSRFRRYRSAWTYMRPHERNMTEFARPKQWFPQKAEHNRKLIHYPGADP